jgi:hypothetical protein
MNKKKKIVFLILFLLAVFQIPGNPQMVFRGHASFIENLTVVPDCVNNFTSESDTDQDEVKLDNFSEQNYFPEIVQCFYIREYTINTQPLITIWQPPENF